MGSAEVVGHTEFILQSSYPKQPVPKLTTKSVPEFLLRSAEATIKDGKVKNWLTNSITGETLTFEDVAPISKSVASAMNKRGMKKGDIALYMTSDVTNIFPTIIGIWRLGGIMHSSYPEDLLNTLLMRIKDTKAKWVFCDAPSVPQVQEAIKEVNWDIEIIVILGPAPPGATHIKELINDDGESCPEKVVENELTDPLLILATSGTTGKSKGAIYTHFSILAFCLGTNTIPRNERPELKILRCTHVLGLLFPIRNVYRGTHSLMMHLVTKENIFKAVDKYKPVLAFGFPTFLIPLAIDPEAKNYDFSSLKTVIVGGMTLTEKFYSVMKSLNPEMEVFNGYGLTECGAISTSIDLSGKRGFVPIENVPPLSCGRLYPNTEIKILDMDTGETLGANQRGEITIRSPILCCGYLNKPEESAEAFKDGWMRTGDLGYYDHDGFVYLVDRIKETFKYYNNHISPAEIEEVILKHPEVAEVSVVGIHDKDGGDHIPRGVVVLKPGSVATSEDIREFADERLEEYKKMRGGIYIVPALPRGKTGKVLKSMVLTMPLL